MKKINIFIIFGILLTLSSCYKEEDWLAENIKEGGTYYPVIQTLTVTPTSGDFTEGNTVMISMQYWSRDDIKEITFNAVLDGVETQLVSTTSSTRFDLEQNVDVLEHTYTIPAGSLGKEITISGVVTTVNDLDRVKESSFTVIE